MAKNDKQWSSAHPGLLIVLLDQSGSMTFPYVGNDTRSVYACKAVNKMIDNIIQKNFDGEAPKNRCFISVIGYGNQVKMLCSGFLKDLDEHPLRVERIKEKQPNGNGGIIEVEVEQPVWVDPIRNNEVTCMKEAFVLAKELVEQWMNDHKDKDAPAPVIINISDGVPYNGGITNEAVYIKETEETANEVMSISNEDGNVLIFNAMISDQNGAKIVFPNSDSNLSSEEARFLYNISSVIPDSYKGAAAKSGLEVQQNSRGCIFQADGIQLIQLIDFGSSKGQGDKMSF